MDDHSKPTMWPEFAVILPVYPGFGALLGLLWPAAGGSPISHCLPAVTVYGVGCGLAIGALEPDARQSTRARDVLVAATGVLWALLVAAIMS